jgi:hypothetical protein
MAKDCCADGACDETHHVHGESFEHADQRVGFRKEQLGEYEAGDNAVQEEVVPFDGGADRAGDNGAAQLDAMEGVGLRTRQNLGHCHGEPPLGGKMRFCSLAEHAAMRAPAHRPTLPTKSRESRPVMQN